VPGTSIVTALGRAAPACLLSLVPMALAAAWMGVRRRGWTVPRALTIAVAGPLATLTVCGLGSMAWLLLALIFSSE